MTTVHSFPVRQQQLPSTMYIAPDTFNAHFGYVLFENYHCAKAVLPEKLNISYQ